MRYVERILVHWSGWDLVNHPLHPTQDQRRKLVERLLAILKEGFWLTPQTENVYGGEVNHAWEPGSDVYFGPDINHVEEINGKLLAKVSYNPKTYRCCFTEIPLKTVEHHAKRYGSIGVGVDRRYLLDRWGAPVHYIRQHYSEVVVWHHARIHSVLKYLEDNPKSISDPVLREAVHQARRSHDYLFQFIKPMSTLNEDDFQFLEEREWRVTWTRSMVARDRSEINSLIFDEKRKIYDYKRFIDKTGDPIPHYEMPVEKTDVQIIVFPDDATRDLALENLEFQSWLVRTPGSPMPDLKVITELKSFEPHEP